MIFTISGLAKVIIESFHENNPELIFDEALFQQILEDCEKLDPLVEEGRIFGCSVDPMGDSGNVEVKVYFAKGAEYSEENRILAEILPHAVRIGVCTDEDSDCREDGEEICLGICWDYPPAFRSPEE